MNDRCVSAIFCLICMNSVFGENECNQSNRILSRQRRYLIFPGGSSIQLIWDNDLYITGEGHLNIDPIVGISVALAWALPDKPTYPEDNYMDLYEDGQLPLLEKRKDSNSSNALNETHVATQQADAIDIKAIMDFLQLISPNSQFNHIDSEMNYENLFDSTPQPTESFRFDEHDHPETHDDVMGYSSMRTDKVHTIYPALGKRYTRSDRTQTWQEKFYLDHHRSTRHTFYEILEKFLFAKGLNGTACVLKTLCQIGRKRDEDEPSTFLAELVRIIFSLPNPQGDQVMDAKYKSYDAAHQTKDDCVESFAVCPGSIWDAEFMTEYYD